MEVEIQIQTDKSTFYENFAEISAIGLTVIRTKKKNSSQMHNFESMHQACKKLKLLQDYM